MNVLMVIESWFGNTRQIGEAVAAGLTEGAAHVTVVNVDDAPQQIPPSVDLLVVGAPTQNRGLSTAGTRGQAISSGGEPGSTGVREWLSSTTFPQPLAIVAFDTATGKNWLNGSAAKAIVKLLGKTKSEIDTRQFVVRGTKGPLLDGEVEAARLWGQSLAKD